MLAIAQRLDLSKDIFDGHPGPTSSTGLAAFTTAVRTWAPAWSIESSRPRLRAKAEVDRGRDIRTVDECLHRALVARDRGCVIPGCETSPGYCHAHHIIHWLDGGPTDLDNLALVCTNHHTMIHNRHITLRHGTDGWRLLATEPDGTQRSLKPTVTLFEPSS